VAIFTGLYYFYPWLENIQKAIPAGMAMKLLLTEKYNLAGNLPGYDNVMNCVNDLR